MPGNNGAANIRHCMDVKGEQNRVARSDEPLYGDVMSYTSLGCPAIGER